MAYLSPVVADKSIQYISMPWCTKLGKGGGLKFRHTWPKSDLEMYCSDKLPECTYKYVGHIDKNAECSQDKFQVNIPLHKLVVHLPIHTLDELCKMHKISFTWSEHKSAILQSKLFNHI
jgi:hypothetical protein